MAKRISTSTLAPKRRSATYKDDVGEQLYECSTIGEMVKIAKGVSGLNLEKLAGVEKRAASGLQLGLVRMQIGNLIRGAQRRAAKGETKAAKSAKSAKKTRRGSRSTRSGTTKRRRKA